MATKFLQVTIRKENNDAASLQCLSEQAFAADRGDTVTFSFNQQPNAVIHFPHGDSPFKLESFIPGPQTVLDAARAGSYGYTVTWTNPNGTTGHGNGGGSVPPPDFP